MDMSGYFGVDRHGLGGGLALLWNSSITVHIQSYSHHHIDANVVHENGLRWRATRFYGHPKKGLRNHSWALLRHLWSIQNLPWLVFGDFNEIMALNEQWGRLDCNLAQMAAFREALADCFLQDLGYHGAASRGLIEDSLGSWFGFVWTDVSPMLIGFLFSRTLGSIMLWWRRQIIWVCSSLWIRFKLQIFAEESIGYC